MAPDEVGDDVRLLIHLEVGEERSVAWWAESPEIPGFSAVGDSLSDLQNRAQWAITDILGESGRTLGRLVVQLVPTEPETANPVAVERFDASQSALAPQGASDLRVATTVLTDA